MKELSDKAALETLFGLVSYNAEVGGGILGALFLLVVLREIRFSC